MCSTERLEAGWPCPAVRQQSTCGELLPGCLINPLAAESQLVLIDNFGPSVCCVLVSVWLVATPLLTQLFQFCPG